MLKLRAGLEIGILLISPVKVTQIQRQPLLEEWDVKPSAFEELLVDWIYTCELHFT